MNFKYKKQIEQLSTQCPPSNYKSKDISAFRFVFEAENDKAKNNFLPVLIIKPKRQLKPDNDTVKCQGYALSLFDSQENAEKRYYKLRKRNKNISKTLGDCLATGTIDKTDGVASEVDNNGHFSLHEFENTDLAAKFNIISTLEGV